MVWYKNFPLILIGPCENFIRRLRNTELQDYRLLFYADLTFS
jgi:hypothetical protein